MEYAELKALVMASLLSRLTLIRDSDISNSADLAHAIIEEARKED